VALGLAALALLALTRGVWSQPDRGASLLGGLLMITGWGLALSWLLGWLLERRQGSISSVPESPAGTVHLLRERPTAPGVLLLWGVALFWNAPVALAAGGAVQRWAQGQPSVPLLVLVAFFALFGLLLLGLAGYATVEEWPRLRGLQSARVELSDHPLRPGGSYELVVCQPGSVRLRALRVLLLCEQHVSYPDGEGDTYEKIESAFQAELVGEVDVRLEDGHPFTARCPFFLPEDARPSNAAEPGKVRWKVVVKGRRAGWHLGFAFAFPVTVVPANEPPVLVK
jgi:hypothetical protein